MTLARRMTLKTVALIGGIVVLAGAMLWGLRGLRQDYLEALGQYQRLRRVYEVGMHVAGARDALEFGEPNAARATQRLEAALGELALSDPAMSSDDEAWRHSQQALAEELQGVLARLKDMAGSARGSSTPPAALLNTALGQLSRMGGDLRRNIAAIDERDGARLRAAATMMGGVILAIILAAAVVGVWQYRGVMVPLRRLTGGVRDLAAGRLSHRLPVDGDMEFRRLAEDFNTMAAELDGLYRQLEQRVADKSRELVRSERLASVGFLAAGVAHEINNPLGIISGHAELSLRRLGRPPGAGAEWLDETREALAVIRDQAFRCKEITAKLLELSRPGAEGRATMSLGKVARDVTAMVHALEKYRDCVPTLRLEGDDAMLVDANETEMRQVVLNLVVNALEAVAAGEGVSAGVVGQVVISGRRDAGWVELGVEDSGRGMAEQTLAHVFEPFFTEKRGAGEPGTGLGLSITHAIVADHGGTIAAASEGPGRGSRFVVRLPAARNGQE